jgi:hypothetical protein
MVKRKRQSVEKKFKIFFFPASVCVGEKENNVVQNNTVSVFFL